MTEGGANDAIVYWRASNRSELVKLGSVRCRPILAMWPLRAAAGTILGGLACTAAGACDEAGALSYCVPLRRVEKPRAVGEGMGRTWYAPWSSASAYALPILAGAKMTRWKT